MTIERGWYPDPASVHNLRWWSGQQWTQETRVRPPDPAPTPSGEHAADAWLPPQMVEFGYLPAVCVRHGLPAVRMQRAPTYSRTPVWVIPLALVSLFIGLLIALAGSLALPSPGLLLLGVALLAAAIVLRGLSDWYRVTSAVVDKQRHSVRVKSPSAAFRAALSGAHSPGQF